MSKTATRTAAPGDRAARAPASLARRLFTRERGWRLAGYLGFLAVWQAVSTFLVESHIVPPPLAIVAALEEIFRSGELLTHFGATLRKIAIGYGIAYAVGVAIGIAMGMRRWWEAFFGDWVMLLLTTPGLVYALVAAMVFGLSPIGPIAAIVVCSFPFVTVNIVEGVKAAPRDLVQMGRSYRVSGWSLQRHVVLPHLAPYLFTALRYGFSVAWKITTLTEIIGSSQGIGFMMRREFQTFSMAGFLAWALTFFAFALLLERVVLQRGIDRFFRWRPEVAS
jgi:NitT/TauT family transport system permease protein